jgi:hypothetical protein
MAPCQCCSLMLELTEEAFLSKSRDFEIVDLGVPRSNRGGGTISALAVEQIAWRAPRPVVGAAARARPLQPDQSGYLSASMPMRTKCQLAQQPGMATTIAAPARAIREPPRKTWMVQAMALKLVQSISPIKPMPGEA